MWDDSFLVCEALLQPGRRNAVPALPLNGCCAQLTLNPRLPARMWHIIQTCLTSAKCWYCTTLPGTLSASFICRPSHPAPQLYWMHPMEGDLASHSSLEMPEGLTEQSSYIIISEHVFCARHWLSHFTCTMSLWGSCCYYNIIILLLQMVSPRPSEAKALMFAWGRRASVRENVTSAVGPDHGTLAPSLQVLRGQVLCWEEGDWCTQMSPAV